MVSRCHKTCYIKIHDNRTRQKSFRLRKRSKTHFLRFSRDRIFYHFSYLWVRSFRLICTIQTTCEFFEKKTKNFKNFFIFGFPRDPLSQPPLFISRYESTIHGCYNAPSTIFIPHLQRARSAFKVDIFLFFGVF